MPKHTKQVADTLADIYLDKMSSKLSAFKVSLSDIIDCSENEVFKYKNHKTELGLTIENLLGYLDYLQCYAKSDVLQDLASAAFEESTKVIRFRKKDYFRVEGIVLEEMHYYLTKSIKYLKEKNTKIFSMKFLRAVLENLKDYKN